MKSDHLIKSLDRRPFNPFVLYVDEVTSYAVPSPHYVDHRPRSGVALLVPLVGGGGDGVALSHISKVTFPDSPLQADPAGVPHEETV